MSRSGSRTNLNAAAADKKAEEINLILCEPDVDLWKLRELALTEGGLINDTLRRRAWPLLVGLKDLWEDENDKSSGCTPKSRPLSSPDSVRTVPTSSSPPITSRSSSQPSLPAAKERYLNAARLGSGMLSPASDTNLSNKNIAASRDNDNCESASECSSTVLSDSTQPSRHNKLATLASSLDKVQIERDVVRCTWHLLTGTQRAQRYQMEHKRDKKVARLIKNKQRRLGNLINYTLVQSYDRTTSDKELRLNYYQGYHDVACIFLSTLGGTSGGHKKPAPSAALSPSSSSYLKDTTESMGLDLPAAVLLQISESHLRDCMKANFMQLQTALQLVLFPLIAALDSEVLEHLLNCGMEPFFSLPWVITWFAHDVRDTDMVKRLFDLFLVSHPLMPIYLTVAMVLHPTNRMEILQTECDFTEIHHTLTHLPKNSSMVGWKYQPGDGYVSDDEENEDEKTNSTVETDLDLTDQLTSSALHKRTKNDTHSMEPQTVSDENANVFVVEGLAEQQQKSRNFVTQPCLTRNTEEETHSMISSSLSSLEAYSRVPFQELIDTAIEYMRWIPPSKLLGLASEHYGWEEVQKLLQRAPSISILQTEPSAASQWAIAPTAKADWVLRQRRSNDEQLRQAKNDRDSKRETKRKNIHTQEELEIEYSGRNASPAFRGISTQSPRSSNEEVVQQYLNEKRHTLAVIASGFGPVDDTCSFHFIDNERRKRRRYKQRRRRRRRILIGSVAAAVVAVGVAFVIQYTGISSSSTSTCSAGKELTIRPAADKMQIAAQDSKLQTDTSDIDGPFSKAFFIVSKVARGLSKRLFHNHNGQRNEKIVKNEL